MNPKSMTMIKLIILLTLNIAFLNQSQASNKGSTTTLLKAQSPSNSVDRTVHSGPDYEYEYEYEQFMKQCERRMTPECAEQIVAHILEDKSVNKTCCATLVKMGPDCHKELLNRERSLPEHTKEIEKEMEKTERLWKTCEIEAGPVIEVKDYPKLPKRRQPRSDKEQFLRECGEKLTEKCGNEVVAALFGGDLNVDNKCCCRLMNMGNDCHEEMVGRLVALARNDGKVDERQVEVRSDLLWKHCEKLTTENK